MNTTLSVCSRIAKNTVRQYDHVAWECELGECRWQVENGRIGMMVIIYCAQVYYFMISNFLILGWQDGLRG